MKYFEGQKIVDKQGKVWVVETFRPNCICLKHDGYYSVRVFLVGNPEEELDKDGYKPLKRGINFT